MLNIIYYSKDRPMQLEASMRSLKVCFKEYDTSNVSVIFDASNAKYIDGYRQLIEDYPEATFIFQDGFKKNTLESMYTDRYYTMFVMDDIFFKEEFSLQDPIFGILPGNASVLSVSLRLSKSMKYCYALDGFMKAPKFSVDTEEYKVWKYPGCDGDWGYGLSLDGNVYRTQHIKFIMESLDFTNPNTLEDMLNQPRVGPRHIACYSKSKLFNVPANRVQDQYKNRHAASHSAEKLNEMFLEGKRISLENVLNLENDAVHYPIDFEFIGG